MTTARGAHDHRMYVDGKWIEAEDGARYAIPNPATEEVVATAPDATRADMRRAIQAARRSFESGPWRRTTPLDRGRILERVADGIEARKEAFRELLVAAHGCEHMTHAINLDAPVAQLRNYAELVHRFAFEETLPSSVVAGQTGGEMVVSQMVNHQPVGVCGLIPTWNFPLFVSVQKIGPALATGCTMVVKPSPYGPLVDLLLAEVIEAAGVPPGVFNVVSGQAAELGAELTESPEIDMVSFTGSVSTGKKVMEAASKTLKRVHLELGGKSASIILDDVDIDLMTAAGAASPAYFHAGQGCAMTTRVLIQKRRHDALLEQMEQFIKNVVKVGDPADPAVFLGPVIRDERRQAIERYIESGREQGALLVTGGGRPAHLAKGWFLEPTVFGNVRNDMRIAREEIFGPVVSVIPFEDEDDAVRIANDSSYGLFGGIQTRDTAKALRMAKQLRTGGVIVNGAHNMLNVPFGGFKESGIGREGGVWGLEAFTEIQAISWRA